MSSARPSATSLAHEVRQQERLPPPGRDDLSDISRVEQLVRAALAPDIPTFDVCSVQGVGFDEWCYSDAFGCLCLWTQSVEINTRLALAAVAAGGEEEIDHAARLLERLGDKWASVPPDPSRAARKVWFPPGANLGEVVATDQVLRAFDEDSSWVLKPHPVTTDEDVGQAVRAFGVTRVLPREVSAYTLLSAADVVGHTTSSELGLIAMMQGVRTVDFTLYELEHRGRFYSLYRAVRESGHAPRDALNRLLQCEWSGIIPLYEAGKDVTRRTRAFKARSTELRERYRPLVPRARF